MPYFWTNTIWYIILGITTMLVMMYILYRTEHRGKMFAFYLTASGVVFVVEAIIFLFFKAYNYYPLLVPGSTLHDGLAGNLFSQFSVASTALLLSVFNLHYRYYILFGVVYGIIEELFLFLGIYQHNWYQTWMTIVLFPIYTYVVKRLYIRAKSKLTPFLYYVYMFLGLWALHFGITVWPFLILGYQNFTPYVFSDPTSNMAFLTIIDYILLYSIMYCIYIKSPKWIWQAAGIAAICLINYIEYRLQLWYVKEGWFGIYVSIRIISMYFYIRIYDKLYNHR